MTPLEKRLGQNTFWLLLARLGTQGLLVLFTLVIAHRLGNVGLGQYAFIASAIFLANTLTTFGTDMFLIREIAAGTGLSQLPATLLIQLALSAICAIIILAGAPLLPNVDAVSIQGLLVYSLALFPLAFFTVFTTALRGQERMYWYAVLNLTVSLAQVLALWIFVQPGSSVITIAWILVAIQTIAAFLAGLICSFQIPGFLRAWHFSLWHIPALLRASAPIALLGLLGMLYLRLSIYQITLLSGSATTGWFSAALRIVEAFKTGHLALFGALYPLLSKAARQPAKSERFVSKSLGWLLGISAVLSLVLYVLAQPLVQILYGVQFAASIAATQILAWIIIPYTLNTFLSLSFLAHRREPAVAWALLGSLLALAILNAWWVPIFGLAGACWAALAAESVQALILVSQYLLQSRSLLLTRETEGLA